MDVQLWRFGTTVQLSSALLIALFFFVLMRTTRRSELTVWVAAWLAHLAALSLALVYGITRHADDSTLTGMRFPFLALESAFVAMLVAGAVQLGRTAPSRASVAQLAVVVLAYSLVLGFAAQTPEMLSALVSATTALVLLSAAGFLALRRHPSFGWLAASFALRGLLALVETVAHGVRLVSDTSPAENPLATVVSMMAGLDAGAEWMIALGGVLAIYDTVARELGRINQDLEATKDELRILSHRDPLTGVFNRRHLPDILNDSRLTGATILFFDLDDFKGINDVHGHHVGDEALRRFARVLTSSFRPGDHVIRYAGDEFIVVGQGIEQVDVRERIDTLRELLAREPLDGLHIHFAVGEAYLPIGGDPEVAIRAADAAMYRRKGEQKQRLA